MKKTILALMLFVLTVTSVFAIDYRYPAGGPTSTADSNVRNVTLTGENSNINYDPTSAVIGLDNQTALVATLIPGNEYSVSVTWGTFNGSYSNAGSVWIDWDQDESYATTEVIGSWTGTPTVTESYTFTVPAEFTGSTRMRVMQREGGSLPLDPAGSYSWGSNMDFTISEYVAGAPDAPALVSPTNGSINVAIDTNLEWTTGDNTDYAVLYFADNAELTGATVVNPATTGYAPAMDYSTTYYWQVVAVSATALEAESPVWSFTTEYGTADVPYTENFDSTGANAQPAGWIAINTTPSTFANVYVSASNSVSGPNSYRIYNSSGVTGNLIGSTPKVENAGNRVSFMAKTTSSTTVPLIVGTMTDATDGETFTAIDTLDLTTTHTQYIVALPAARTEAHVSFKHGFGGTYKYIYIDDVNIEEIPANPIVQITTDPIDFGSLALNEVSEEEIVSIKNIGGGLLTITNLEIIGADADQFAYTATEDYALAATEELLVSVIFTPTSDGEKTATLQITDDLTREVYEIALSGIGIDTNIYEVNIPYTQDFETEEGFVGWTSALDSDNSYSKSERYSSSSSAHTGTYSHRFYHSSSATYTNAELISPVVVPDMDAYRVRFWAKKSNSSNNDPLVVGKYNQAMDSFTAIDSLDLTTTYVEYSIEMIVPVRANERIAFQANLAGAYQYIYIDDVTLEEIPEGALVQITPDAYDFGSIFIASQASQTFTVANNGVVAAQITEVTVPAGYSFETELSFPYSLEAGASFAVNVTFAPLAEMIYSGNLRVKEAAGFTPINHDVALTGSGIPVPQGDNHNNPFIMTLADSVTVTGTTTPFQTYYPFCSSQSVVYQLTLPTDKLMTVSLEGTAWDTKLWIFNSFQQIDEALVNGDAWYYNDDEHSASTGGDRAKSRDRATWSKMLETYTPAGEYYIVVAGFGSNNGDYTLTVETADIPLPTAATNPSPANEATSIATATTLSWTNPEYTDNVDLYFGTPEDMTLLLDNVVAVEEYEVTDLEPSTLYNWKVVARNVTGDTPEVDVVTWSFTTIGSAPEAVTYTAPADGAINRPLSGNLTWSAATGATGYNVFFSTDETFADVTPVDQAGTSFAYSGLEYSSTHYWKVIPYNVVGQPTEGILVWSFTTIPDPTMPMPVFVDFEGSTSIPAEITSNNFTIGTNQHGTTGNVMYKNIYSTATNGYIQFQSMNNITATSIIEFDYRVTLWSAGTTAVEFEDGHDYLVVSVSTDNGATFAPIDQINSTNHVDSNQFATFTTDISAYAGQSVIFRFEMEDDTVHDYWFDIDNIYFGEPASTPIANLSATEIDFGSVNVGETGTEDVTISNIGVGTLTISAIEIYGPNADDFAYSTAPEASMALGEDQSLVITVNFTPTAEGTRDATLQITDDLGNRYRINSAAKNTNNSRNLNFVTLSGNALDPVIRNLPFTEGFEENNTHNSTDVALWSQISEIGSGAWTINETLTNYNRTPRTGSFNVTLKYSNTDWLIRPVELTGGQAYDFELYARQDGATAANSNVGLYYGTEATTAAMVSITGQIGIVNGDYQLISGTFTPETSGIYYLGIKGFMNGSPWYISIDDITIKESEAVADPEIPTNVSITADGTIVITWEAADNANSYNVYACDTPDGDYTETPIASVDVLTYTYEGTENMKFFKVKASSETIGTSPTKGFGRK